MNSKKEDIDPELVSITEIEKFESLINERVKLITNKMELFFDYAFNELGYKKEDVLKSRKMIKKFRYTFVDCDVEKSYLEFIPTGKRITYYQYEKLIRL